MGCTSSTQANNPSDRRATTGNAPSNVSNASNKASNKATNSGIFLSSLYFIDLSN
jgi:hypothetical protein